MKTTHKAFCCPFCVNALTAGPGQIDQHIKKSHYRNLCEWIKTGRPDAIQIRYKNYKNVT